MKKWKETRKIVIGAIVLSGIAILSVTAAVINNKLIKTKENNFIPAEISIAVQENDSTNTQAEASTELLWETGDSADTYEADKEVKIKNVDVENKNNAQAWIRVCIVSGWKGADPETKEDNEEDELVQEKLEFSYESFIPGSSFTEIEITNNKYQIGDVTFLLDENWEDGWFYNDKDGYFYCKTIVSPGETTPKLLSNVYIKKDTLEKDYQDLELYVDILADSIQTEGGALKARWTEVEEIVEDDVRMLQPVAEEGGKGE